MGLPTYLACDHIQLVTNSQEENVNQCVVMSKRNSMAALTSSSLSVQTPLVVHE